MSSIWSETHKFTTWRLLWVTLAESQRELGLPITTEQVEEMRSAMPHLNILNHEDNFDIRLQLASHISFFRSQCPNSQTVIHLGATDNFILDNAYLITLRESLFLLRHRLLTVIDRLQTFALLYRAIPTLAFTHFQAAQPTTVGRRACLWIQDLLMDFEMLQFQLSRMRLLRGNSFQELFDGDVLRSEELDQVVCSKMQFNKCYPACDLTYPHKVEAEILNVLSGIAQSASKFSGDLRLLQHLKQIEEPFEDFQVGSSAMPYKRNPMRSERIASLARYVIVDTLNPAITAASQCFERSFDNCANQGIAVPQAFLAVDALLLLYANVVAGLEVYPNVIQQHFMKEIPFMATENILMKAVQNGGDRQELHEKLRKYSKEAAKRIKDLGLESDLCEKVAADSKFGITFEEIMVLLDPVNFVGRAPAQVGEFVEREVKPLLVGHAEEVKENAEVVV
jgi:adenylosuccinate lyase